MKCKKCGAEIDESRAFCSACGAKTKNKQRKKPFFLIRFFLQVASLVLYAALLVGLLGTVLLADVQILTSSDGIETLLTHLVNGQQEQTTPVSTEPAVGSPYLQRLSATTSADEYTGDENGSTTDPDDADADAASLADHVYDLVKEILGEDIPISPEQVLTFMMKSNIMEFMAEKTASVVEAVISGNTDVNPFLTADDISQIVEENQELIEETFQITVTPDMKDDIHIQAQEALHDGQFNAALREQVDLALATPVPGKEDMTLRDLLVMVSSYAQVKVLCLAIAACLALMAVLMLLNYYNLPEGLNWNASACTSAGLLLSAPLMILHISPALLENFMPETAETLALIDSAAHVISPLHYGLLILGLVMAVAALVWNAQIKKH